MKTRTHLCLMGLLLALLHPAPSLAQVTFYVAADGDRAFIIEGADISPNSEVELTVVYDSQGFTNPRVSVEQGSVTDINDAITDTLIIKAVQGDFDTQTYHVRFDKKGDRPGRIYSVTGTIADPDGTISPTQTVPYSSSPDVLLPQPQDEEKTAFAETGATGGNAQIVIPGQNVLQRFREFKGKPGLNAFSALFDRSPGDRNIQEPPVVLSDGKTLVRIAPALLRDSEDAPDIALSDAKLVHVAKEDGMGWVITALPNKGTWDAGLIIRTGGKIYELPLVVAPPVTIDKDITEKNFLAELDRFRAERIAAGAWEGKPNRPALFEYVFTANCLAGWGKASHAMAAEVAGVTNESKSAKLLDFALFASLEAGVVPLGFPALFENRDQVRRALFADEIFPPIHWPIDAVVPLEFGRATGSPAKS